MPTYQTVTHWQLYQRYFPPELRCGPEAMPLEESWRWRDLDVHLDRFPLPDAPLKVLLVHGAGGYGRMLAPYARMIALQGYETVVPDLPGYGLTRATGPTAFDDWTACVADLVDAERGRDRRPVVVFGLSIGGLVAYGAAARAGADGLLATCFPDPRLAEVRDAVARHAALAQVGLPLLQGLAPVLDSLRLPIGLLANVGAMANLPEVNALVAADGSGGGNWVGLRFLRTYLGWLPPVEPEAFVTCPVLLVHPGADRWTPLALSRPFYDRLPGPKQLVELERCGHMPLEEPGLSQMAEAIAGFLRELGPRR